MNRRHDVASYLTIVEKLRTARPDIALSSDFIVGFPGETDADFEATLKLIRQTAMASAYSFKYSPRPGTKAAEAVEQVPEAVKAERLARLQELEVEQRRAFNAASVGRVVDVLFEKRGRHAGQIGGKSPWAQAVHAEGPDDLIGHVAPVRITSLKSKSLAGELMR
jgi:tRNA-2-methylthio-N6-dimethylallyladenosine synthase